MIITSSVIKSKATQFLLRCGLIWSDGGLLECISVLCHKFIFS